jgi:hypothetical protein
MEKKTLLNIAGVLLLIVALWSLLLGGILTAIGSIIENTQVEEMLKDTYDELEDALADADIESFEEFKDFIVGISQTIGIVTLVEGVIILLGAVAIFLKRFFVLAIVGAILGILNLASLSLYFIPLVLSIVSLILLWMGKELFGSKERAPQI